MDREEENARDAFEQERKILLSGVAESLSSVVKQMARANANLTGIEDSTGEVEKVAGLWKAAYRGDNQQQGQHDNHHHHHSSDPAIASSLSLLHDDAV